jgi:threonine synthase
VFSIAIDGSFDDAQSALKEIFGDKTFSAKHRLSAVNSINLARVLAQCVYYLYAWLRIPAKDRANIEFVVPTGNFGNVLAGWLLSQMGVGVAGFKVATNQNDILHRLFSTGEYRVGDVHASLAPSMDIQVASNFERFLYFLVGRDPAKVRTVMAAMKSTGAHSFENFDKSVFSSSRASDADITEIIRRVYAQHGYVVDPHTACGFKDLNPARVSVVLSTAHPAKFPSAIRDAIGQEPTHPTLEALKSRLIVKHLLSANVDAIKAFVEARAV